MKPIVLPEKVEFIIRTLNEHGFEAYAVGGCVRDSLLGREPKDWDITTSALPQEVKSAFRNTYDTGIEHGTVSVRLGTEIYEVTTFRVDGTYSDHRHPDGVSFSADLKEDLKRRDFTMNAMAWHPKKGLIDLFGGQEDLRREIIRCVGIPAQRFDEDALRMLRAYRFAARFGFAIDLPTQKAIQSRAPFLAQVSAERIREEMNQIMKSAHPDLLREVVRSGLMQHIVPEFLETVDQPQRTPYHCYPVEEHTYRTMLAIPADSEGLLLLRWAAFLHDIAKPRCRRTDAQGVDHFKGHPQQSAQMASVILKRLRFDNDTRFRIEQLVAEHDQDFPQDERQMRHVLSKLPPKTYPLLLSLQLADAQAKNPAFLAQTQHRLELASALYEKVVREGQCVKLADLAINGRDLIELGFERGKLLGEVLAKLLDQVLDHPQLNEKTILLEIAERILQSRKEENGHA